MIVDRSSFDEEDRQEEDDLMSLGVAAPGALFQRQKRSDGKVRRKLRWKPAAFRSSKNRKSSTDASVITNQSVRTTKSILSFHTFHSTETPVQSNQRNKQPVPPNQPNYRDTFEGVSTIANEGQYIHAKTSNKKELPPRSSTLPSRSDSPSSSFDFKSMDGESYSADDLDSLPVVAFDTYGNNESKKSFKKKRPPRAGNKAAVVVVAQNKSESMPVPRNNSPGESPVPRKRSVRRKIASPGEAPLDISSSEQLSEEELDAPFLLKEEFEVDRRVSPFKRAHPNIDEGFGVSPIKSPLHTSPFATPTKYGRPPMVPLRYTSTLSPISSAPAHIALTPPPPPPATTTDGSNAPSSVSNYMVNSGKVQGQSMPDMPITSAANKLYNQPVDTRNRSVLMLGSARGEDESLSTSSAASNGSAKAGNVARNGSSVGSSGKPASKPSKETCPVDFEDGAFVEAERHLKAIHEMAAEHLAHGEYEEALDVFEEILRGQLERYGADHYRVGTALHNVGIVHLKSGNYVKAVEVCQVAIKVRKQALVPNHPDVAVSLAQLGVAQLECKQYRLALIAFREALEIRREFLGRKHPKVGKILNNVGCALYELDELDGARLAFEEALEIQRESLRSSTVSDEEVETRSNSNQILLSIAATLCNIGSIKVRWYNFDEATIVLEEALLVSELLVEHNIWFGFTLILTNLVSFRSSNSRYLVTNTQPCLTPLKVLSRWWSQQMKNLLTLPPTLPGWLISFRLGPAPQRPSRNRKTMIGGWYPS